MKKLFIFFGILFLVSGCDNAETKTLSCSSSNDQNGITTKTRYDFKYLNDEVKHVTITYDYTQGTQPKSNDMDGVNADTDGISERNNINENNNRVKWYLTKRGIDKDIINECIDNDLIYETAYNHNVVFVGIDENKIPRYAGVRGTNSKKFMMDASGSDKTYSFRIEALEITDTIHLFESAIDLLSYATYEKERQKEWYKDTLIALAGVYQPATKIEDSKIPVALNYYLKKNQNIKRIVIHFDNDSAGRMATKALQTILSNKYEVIDKPPKFGKDFNDFLCATKGINSNKNEIKRKEGIYEK